MLHAGYVAANIGLGITTSVSFAWDTSQWQNLETLKPGQTIGIIQSDQKRVEGQFKHVTESGITLRAIGEVTVPKEKVIRVYRKPGRKRAIRVVVGAGIGSVAGAILTSTPDNAFGTKARMCPVGPGSCAARELEPASVP